METTTPTAAQVKLFDLAFKAAKGIDKAINSQLEAMKVWLNDQYGTKPPTYEQFWADRDALKSIAQEKGLVDDQWVRKPYNMAVKAVYGELPVSTTIAAISKRAVRPAAKTSSAAAINVKQNTRNVKVNMPEDAEAAVRQMLAHYGMARVLIAFSTILAEHKETMREATRVRNLGDHMMSAAH